MMRILHHLFSIAILAVLLSLSFQPAQGQPLVCEDFAATLTSTPTMLGACSGMVSVSVSGGTAPFSIITPTFNTTISDSTTTFGNICAGNYCLTIIDATGCFLQSCVAVEATGGSGCSTLTATATTTPASCNNACDGTATVVVGGGTPPYNIMWGNGAVGSSLSSLCAGTYIAIATDANGCAYTLSLTITSPSSIVLNLDIMPNTTTSPVEPCNGSISAMVSGGVPPYIYTMIPTVGSGGTPPNYTGLCAGTYCVAVSDANGCTAQSCGVVINDSGGSGCSTLVATYNSTPATCSNSIGGSCDGTALIIAAGGTPPYQIVLDGTFLVGGVATDVCAGTHVGIVTDASGCAFTLLVVVSGPSPILLDLAVTPNTSIAASPLECNGSITPTVTGGTAPYTYTITPSTGAFFPPFGNLCAGTYCVAVTDANGCAAQSCVVVLDEGGGSCLGFLATVTTTPSVGGACTGSITLIVSGGTAPFVAELADSSLVTFMDSPFVINNVCPGTYSIPIIDVNGCLTQVLATVSIEGGGTPPTAQSDTVYAEIGQSITIAPLNNDSGTGTLNILSATVAPPNSIEIDFDNDLITLVANPSGGFLLPIVISYVIVDSNGEVATGTIVVMILPEGSCDNECVYPGDADNNGTADNFDVLQIGLGYDYSGTPRADQSIVWYAHTAQDWGGAFPAGMDYKFGDCNGSGIIDVADTAAVSLNYGLTHGKGDAISESGIPLFFEPEMVGVADGNDTLYLSVHLGNDALIADEFYGIAFSVNYDPTLAQLVGTQIAADSWAGNSSNSLLFAKNLSGNARADYCLTRTDHSNVSGGGAIIRAKFVIIENIDGGKGDALQSSVSSPFSFGNIRCISHDGTVLEVAPEEIVITTIPQSQNNNPLAGVSTFPNPAQNWLYVSLPATTLATIRICDVAGRIVYSAQDLSGLQSIATNGWGKGIYFVQTTTQEGMQVEKIVVGQ